MSFAHAVAIWTILVVAILFGLVALACALIELSDRLILHRRITAPPPSPPTPTPTPSPSPSPAPRVVVIPLRHPVARLRTFLHNHAERRLPPEHTGAHRAPGSYVATLASIPPLSPLGQVGFFNTNAALMSSPGTGGRHRLLISEPPVPPTPTPPGPDPTPSPPPSPSTTPLRTHLSLVDVPLDLVEPIIDQDPGQSRSFRSPVTPDGRLLKVTIDPARFELMGRPDRVIVTISALVPDPLAAGEPSAVELLHSNDPVD